jgi:hypothetical protein
MKKAICLGVFFSLSAGSVFAQLEFVKKLQSSIDEKVQTTREKGRADGVTLDAQTKAANPKGSDQSTGADGQGGGDGKSN